MSAWVTQQDVDLLDSDMRRHVARALCRLSPRQERVVRLHLMDEQTQTEIACQMGVSPTRVNQIERKAERRLRKLLWPAAKDLLT